MRWKRVCYDREFGKLKRKAEHAPPAGRQEQSETVRLVLPEHLLAEEAEGRGEELSRLRRSQTSLYQPGLGLGEQVLEAKGILLYARSHPVGRKEHRDARTLPRPREQLDVLPSEQIGHLSSSMAYR